MRERSHTPQSSRSSSASRLGLAGLWMRGRRAGERVVLLGRLRRELVGMGVRARVARGVAGPAYLWMRGESGRTARVLCLGAGETYVFITECGRLLGVADEAGIGEAARSLVWLLDPPVTLNAHVGQ